MNSEVIHLVGAGAVNLISASLLQAHGYLVHIIDAAPDPNVAPTSAGQLEQGATWTGEGVRMFTLTEADNHNIKHPGAEPNAGPDFRKPVSRLGWDARRLRGNDNDNGNGSDNDESWIRAHERVPWDQARQHSTSIVRFNQESAPLWAAMMARSKELFHGTLVREGIIRLYSDAEECRAQLARHQALGALLHSYAPLANVLDDAPGLAGALDSGFVTGAFKTAGFTLDARRMLRQLIAHLTQNGAEFCWGEKATAIEQTADGRIKAVHTTRQTLERGHFVLSLGAYGNELLRTTRAAQLICGVLGVWATIPNIAPAFAHSMKIVRKGHVTKDANVIVMTRDGEPVLIAGSGYGFTGRDPRNIDPGQLDVMHRGLEDTIARCFPAAYEQAKDTAMFAESRRHCVRPWTANGLGVFEQLTTVHGNRLLITGANNTGGFAQAPAVAQAVLAAIRGQAHPMHALYNGARAE